ncbi:hypothetical protein [uncultured Selenomonas sp.]|uniref:hypothetical protein n=1 Tax=uncultured Selenomonas sp. TaxID=159275 RepID=UPI0028D54BB2|nr:hypothetical protein [uncultured Selenomonas sp.]
MFDKQYRFMGKHAEKVNALTAVFDEASKAKLFERNLDVYINAPLIGFLYRCKAEKDTTASISPQNIFPEQMMNAADRLKYILRLIILLDKEYEPDESVRMDRAFRYFGREEELALFDRYVLGGVDVLYEKLIEGDGAPSEYVNRLYEFLEEFQDRYHADVTGENILALCREADH